MVKMKRVKVVIVTNIPAPYREKVYEKLSEKYGGELDVIYCSKLESNRKWEFKYGNYKKHFLNSKTFAFGEVNYHLNTSIWRKLNELQPDVVITAGFAVPMILSFIWAQAKNKIHICFTDGTRDSEQHLSAIHRFVRRFIFYRSGAFVGASNKSIRLYESYGISYEKIFKSCLCVDNERFLKIKKAFSAKKYDILFSGQFVKRKLPFFFSSVSNKLHRNTNGLKVAIIGSGPLEKELLASLDGDIDVDFLGFVQQEELPNIYSDSKFLLFPTKNDPWGVVANEAIAAGCLVVTCENAGVAGEIVKHEETGLVLTLSEELWSTKILEYMNHIDKYTSLTKNATNLITDYNYQSASDGLHRAIQFSLRQ